MLPPQKPLREAEKREEAYIERLVSELLATVDKHEKEHAVQLSDIDRASYLNKEAIFGLIDKLNKRIWLPDDEKEKSQKKINNTMRKIIATEQSTSWVIKDAATVVPIKVVYRCTYGPTSLRFVRYSADEWYVDITDPSRPVKNSDEKYYGRPSYLRGFIRNNLPIYDVDMLRWTKEESLY